MEAEQKPHLRKLEKETGEICLNHQPFGFTMKRMVSENPNRKLLLTAQSGVGLYGVGGRTVKLWLKVVAALLCSHACRLRLRADR